MSLEQLKVKQNNDSSSKKKARPKVAKTKIETVMPEGLKVQVHERIIPPDSYKICNGTSFEPYRPKPWGR